MVSSYWQWWVVLCFLPIAWYCLVALDSNCTFQTPTTRSIVVPSLSSTCPHLVLTLNYPLIHRVNPQDCWLWRYHVSPFEAHLYLFLNSVFSPCANNLLADDSIDERVDMVELIHNLSLLNHVNVGHHTVSTIDSRWHEYNSLTIQIMSIDLHSTVSQPTETWRQFTSPMIKLVNLHTQSNVFTALTVELQPQSIESRWCRSTYTHSPMYSQHWQSSYPSVNTLYSSTKHSTATRKPATVTLKHSIATRKPATATRKPATVLNLVPTILPFNG